MSVDISEQVSQDSLFLVKEGLKHLRLHASNMATDSDAITRLIREADLLSLQLKRLEAFLDSAPNPQEVEPSTVDSDPIDIAASLRIVTAILGGELCKKCGGVC